MENLIPKLRFPEFKGEWVTKKLGDVFSIFNGYAFSSTESVEKGILWVKIADVGIQEMKKDNLSYLPLNLKEKHSKFLLKKGDYVVALTRPILSGKLKIAQIDDFFEGSLLNQRVGKIETSNSSAFVYCYLQKNELIKSIENNIAGSDPPNLSPTEINSIELIIPSLPEQQKIATFLTSVDEKLQALKKKKSLLEQYKKGVMQKIFSQELRFKDENGNDFPDWEEKTLGDIMSLPEKIKPLKIDKDKLLTVKLHLKGVLKNESTESLSIGATSYYLRKKGQFIYGKQNLFNGAFGIIPEQFDGFLSSGDVPTLDINNTKINSDFLFYFMGRETFYKKLEDVASGSGSKRIHEETLFKVEISLPSILEQTFITNFISSIDDKINHCGEQIAKMEVWKKGLLQGMFC